jgi:uncharacterized protein (TIGR02246 family)
MASDEILNRELIQTWLRASAENQLDVILNLMDEDVIFLRQGMPPMRGKQTYAETFKANAGKFKIDARSDVQEIQVEGNLAYCLSNLQVPMTPITIGTLPKHMAGNVL